MNHHPGRTFYTAFIPIIFFFFLHTTSGQSVEKIEPPNWWSGMKETQLQLMVYGKDIGLLKAKTKYSGVTIKQTSSPGSKDYLFIDLQIKKNCKPGSVLIRLSDADQEITTFSYPILARTNNSSQREGFSTKDVIYLITPDRFVNADPGNDNIDGMPDTANRNEPYGRHGGDIQGIQQNLHYIKDLGCSAVWLNPVLENNMPRHSYHGYAITDFYTVDKRFGTNESFKQLSTDASAIGIKMIMDMVANHCGLHHSWITNPPTNDWINYYQQPYQQTNHRKSISMDLYVADADKKILTDGWFVATMPDLNTSNPYLQRYLIQNAIWWIEYAQLAGIRMDTYLYPDEDFMSDWAKAIMNEYPRFNISGEVWHDNPSIVAYWQKDKVNPNGYQSYLPSLFDFPSQAALRNALTKPEAWNSGWVELYDVLAQDVLYPDPQNLVVFADNHDMSRIYSQLGNDFAKFAMAMAYTLTVRGIPQLYYGSEVLLENKGNNDNDHGIIRADFPGGWKDDVINVFEEKGLTATQRKAKKLVHDLIDWRNKNEVIHTGNTIHFTPDAGVYVYGRYNDKKRVLVILNKNEKPVTLKMDRFSEFLTGDTTGQDILSGRKIDWTTELDLDEPGPLIIEIRGGILKN